MYHFVWYMSINLFFLTGFVNLLVLTLRNDLWLKALILPFCFVFVDKYSVLRGVAGEGESERGRAIQNAI